MDTQQTNKNRLSILTLAIGAFFSVVALTQAADDPATNATGPSLVTGSGRSVFWRGQLVELRNASEPVRIHTWERAATWGRAVFK